MARVLVFYPYCLALSRDPIRREVMGCRARQSADTEFCLDRHARRFAGRFTP